MSSNTLNTRIRSKIDYLANWNSNTTFIPLLGEICIAIIPRNIDATNASSIANNVDTSEIGVTGVERQPRQGVGLTPYAIGIKVGDGSNNFATLPWIQAIAGDVYAWAKNATPPSANQISAQYGTNQSGTVQDAINNIQDSIGGIVSSGISADALSSALQQLQSQLTDSTSEVFNSDSENTDYDNDDNTALPLVTHTNPTKIIRTITQNGLNITTTSSPIEEADLPNIHMSKISDLVTTAGYNSSTSPITTKNYVDSELSTIRAQISGGISFLGIVYESDLLANNSLPITDGSSIAPIFRVSGSNPIEYRTTQISSLTAGNVILYKGITTTTDPNDGNNEITTDAEIGKEFIWTGSVWEEFGDEGSFAVKGSIEKADLSSTLQTEINNKLTATQADLDAKLDSNTAASTYVAKNGTDRLMTAEEGSKLLGIATGAQVNVIEEVQVNGAALTITNKSVNVEVPILKIKQKSTTGTDTDVTPNANDKSITLAAIAFDGEVRNLKQTDSTYLVFNCGNATTELFD